MAMSHQQPRQLSSSLIPLRSGVGFKANHGAGILKTKPGLGWFEVHPENYMVAGGPRHALLTEIRDRYPLSLHGVALSLAGAEPLDEDHLQSLKALIGRYEPGLVSEHLAWSAHGGHYFADLLPVPLSSEALGRVCENVDRTQEALGRQILIENPSTYLPLEGSDIPEPEFLMSVAKRTGCGLLLDVNNIYVSTQNLDGNAEAYVDAIDGALIGEVHLAGHAVDEAGPECLLIDDHGSAVRDPVWDLYARLIRRVGLKPTLVEWDTNVPEWPVLFEEARKAERTMNEAAVRREMATA